jgi:hypothetical protein
LRIGVVQAVEFLGGVGHGIFSMLA